MGLTVLVVDDNDSMRTLIVLRLQAAGLAVAGEAENGAEALEALESMQPDVVVMDREMPGMDGPTATREIKRRWPDLRVVGLTSYPVGLLKEAGADHVFNKTDSIDDFIQYMTELAR